MRKQFNQNSDATILKAIKLYLQGMGSTRVANKIGVGEATVLKWLDKAGVKKRNPKDSIGIDWDKIRVKVKELQRQLREQVIK